MRINRKLIVVPVVVAAALSFSGCTNQAERANAHDQVVSGQILTKAEQVQPAPEFDYSQIRQTLIDAERATAESTQTTTFMFNQGVADPVFWCPSIGFPVAADSEITNPEQVTDGTGPASGTGNVTLPQMDPNMIYQGLSTATYVICVNDQGQKYLHHVEEFAHAVSGPATWDYKHHRIVMTGDPTFKVTAPKN